MLDPEKLKICIHCGLCLEACPTYRVLKNEADSPRGRIALMRGVTEGKIEMTQTVLDHLDGCLDCRACETACPAGVPYGELIEEGRAELYPRIETFKKRSRLMRLVLKEILGNPKRLRVVSKLLQLYQRSGFQWFVRKSGILKLLPAWIRAGDEMLGFDASRSRSGALDSSFSPDFQSGSEVHAGGEVGYFPPRGFRNREHPSARSSTKTTQVALFRGCIGSILFPQVEAAAIKVLRALGCSVRIPENQVCCGALLVHGGFREDAGHLARKNIKAFQNDNCDFIAVTAAGCGSTLKEYSRDIPEAPHFSDDVQDITEIILKLGVSKEKLKPLPLRVAYQDACHLVHAQRVREAPRVILNQIPEVKLLDLPHSDWCCGSAGIYNLTHPELADKLLVEKISSILSVNPDVVAVGNPGCALQIGMGLSRTKPKIPVLHPIELLAQSICPDC